MSRSSSANKRWEQQPARKGRWLWVGRGGAIAAERVVALGRASSAPIKRLLEAAGPRLVLNLTYGEPRQTVLVLDTGHLAVISQPLEEVLTALETEEA